MADYLSGKSLFGLMVFSVTALFLVMPAASEIQINDPDGMTFVDGNLDMGFQNITNVNTLKGILKGRYSSYRELIIESQLDMKGHTIESVGSLSGAFSASGVGRNNISIFSPLDMRDESLYDVNEIHVNALENDNDNPVVVKPTDDPGVDWGMRFENPTSSSIGPVYDNNLHMGGAMVLETSGVGMFGTGSYSQDAAFEFGNDRSDTPPEGEIETQGTLNVGNCDGCDLAETIEKGEESDLGKGDVVSINRDGDVVKASAEYDSKVAGVVSSSPVLLMGTEGGGADFGRNISGDNISFETKEGKKEIPLALEGLVPVKASAVNGSIKPGDKLATSGIPGYAMKAEPIMEKDGREVYGSGIIGKAMEPLESGKGKIQMLASIE